MAYTNEMRHAVRAINNPVPVNVNVSQKDGQIFLLLNKVELAPLTDKQHKDLQAYLREVKGIIKLGGGGDAKVATV